MSQVAAARSMSKLDRAKRRAARRRRATQIESIRSAVRAGAYGYRRGANASVTARIRGTTGGDSGGGGPTPGSMPLLEHYIVSRTNTPAGFVDFDADSASNRYTHARSIYSGLEWRWRVVVKGLPLPYYVEIDDGPAGMEILRGGFLLLSNGQWVWDPDCYVLEWQNPTPGTHNLRLIARGQNLVSVTSPNRTLHVETDRHYFMGGTGASNSNDGLSPSSPWLNDLAIHGGNSDTSSVLPGVLHIQGNGNIDVQGETSSGNYVMNASGQPRQIVTVPGDTPTLRTTNGRLTVNSVAEAYFQGFQIEMLNPVSSFQNRGFIHVLGPSGNVRLDSIDFRDFVDGTVTGQENGSCFTTYSQDVNYRDGIAMVNCTQSGDSCSFWNTYSLRGAVFMGNRMFSANYVNTDSASTAQQMRWKRYTTQCLAAFNELWDSNFWAASGGIGYNSFCDNSEFAYNKIAVGSLSSSQVRQAAMRLSTGSEGNIGNNHGYRNSLKGDALRAAIRYDSPPGDNYATLDLHEFNLLDGTNNQQIQAVLGELQNNISAANAGTLLDASMNPIGAGDVATHGARVLDLRRAA